jgi:hypothetical protein
MENHALIIKMLEQKKYKLFFLQSQVMASKQQSIVTNPVFETAVKATVKFGKWLLHLNCKAKLFFLRM